MILTLMVVAQLNKPVVGGVELKPSYAITEPSDIQPALSYNMIQEQHNVTKIIKPVKTSVCGLTPCITVREVQTILNVHELYKSGAIK